MVPFTSIALSPGWYLPPAAEGGATAAGSARWAAGDDSLGAGEAALGSVAGASYGDETRER